MPARTLACSLCVVSRHYDNNNNNNNNNNLYSYSRYTYLNSGI